VEWYLSLLLSLGVTNWRAPRESKDLNGVNGVRDLLLVYGVFKLASSGEIVLIVGTISVIYGSILIFKYNLILLL